MLHELEHEINIKYQEVLDMLKEEIKKSIVTARILIGILAILLFLTNMAWLYAWCQYDYISTDISTSIGDATYIEKGNYNAKN